MFRQSAARTLASAFSVLLLLPLTTIAAEPKEIVTLSHECDSCPVTALSFSPDGKLIASAVMGGLGLKNEIKIWDLETRKPAKLVLKAPVKPWATVAFSPNGEYLAGGGMFDDKAYVWSTKTGEQLHAFEHKGMVWCARFSPDSKLLATAEDWGFINVWDVSPGKATGKAIATLHPSTDRAFAVAFSPDMKRLAGGDREGTIHLWDWPSKMERKSHTDLFDHVRSVAFRPDSKQFAGACGSKLKIFRSDTGEQLHAFDVGESSFRTVEYSPNGQLLAASLYEGTVTLRETKKYQIVTSFNVPANLEFLTFSPDSKTLATSNKPGSFTLWDVSPWADGKK